MKFPVILLISLLFVGCQQKDKESDSKLTVIPPKVTIPSEPAPEDENNLEQPEDDDQTPHFIEGLWELKTKGKINKFWELYPIQSMPAVSECSQFDVGKTKHQKQYIEFSGNGQLIFYKNYTFHKHSCLKIVNVFDYSIEENILTVESQSDTYLFKLDQTGKTFKVEQIQSGSNPDDGDAQKDKCSMLPKEKINKNKSYYGIKVDNKFGIKIIKSYKVKGSKHTCIERVFEMNIVNWKIFNFDF